MLRTRVITACVLGVLLLLGRFLLPPPWGTLAFALVFTIGAWEFAAFGGLRGGVARSCYTAAMAAAFWAAWHWSRAPDHLLMLLAAACCWWVGAFLWLTLRPLKRNPGWVLFCGLPVLVPAFVALARLQISNSGATRGPMLVLWLVLLVCAADIGAYFAGRRFGRHKLAPLVSPGKTWEGALGGLLAVLAIALIGAVHFNLSLVGAGAFGCAVGAFSVIGDLTESMFKRAANLKDSGTLLPGHGGLLDRIDSVTAAAPLYALGLFGTGVIP
jgi:phosphatidate cytidylyltransferase